MELLDKTKTVIQQKMKKQKLRKEKAQKKAELERELKQLKFFMDNFFESLTEAGKEEIRRQFIEIAFKLADL